MMREKLPALRRSMIFEFTHEYPGAGPRVFTASAGFYPDGRLGEVFIHLVDGKDKLVSVDAHDAAIVISLALQHGADLKVIGPAMLRGEDGAAHGCIGSMIDALEKLA